MRIIKRTLLLVLTLLLIFVVYTLVSTGFFRTVENQFDGSVLHTYKLKGAEDLTISYADSFAIVSATDRVVFPPEKEEEGDLHLLDLSQPNLVLKRLTGAFKGAFAPHGISMYKTDSLYTVAAINHTPEGHSIEIFEWSDYHFTHIETLSDPSMISPNDLVMIDRNRFYFTNDHRHPDGLGRFLEDYAGRAISKVVKYNGKTFREVAEGITYANGINYDASRQLLYVASPRKFLVKVYSRNEDNSLEFIEDIPCGTGVDNIEIDPEGHLWIGAHPNLLRFAAYAKGNKPTAPSEIIKVEYRGKGDYSVESLFTDDGNLMSGSSVAAPFGDLILTGNVMDSKFLILQSKQ